MFSQTVVIVFSFSSEVSTLVFRQCELATPLNQLTNIFNLLINENEWGERNVHSVWPSSKRLHLSVGFSCFMDLLMVPQIWSCVKFSTTNQTAKWLLPFAFQQTTSFDTIAMGNHLATWFVKTRAFPLCVSSSKWLKKEMVWGEDPLSCLSLLSAVQQVKPQGLLPWPHQWTASLAFLCAYGQTNLSDIYFSCGEQLAATCWNDSNITANLYTIQVQVTCNRSFPHTSLYP